MKTPVILILALALSLCGCEDMFQSRVPMNKAGTASLADLFARDEELPSQLSPPAQVYASQGQFPFEIQLTWSPVKWAASYLIERAVIGPDTAVDPEQGPGEEYFDVLESFVTGTSYTDTSLISDPPRPDSPEYRNRYYYRIYAENVEKNIESSRASASAEGALFSPPGNVRAALGKSTDNIRVEWNSQARAVSYYVYRSDEEHGTNSYYVGKTQGNQTWLINAVDQTEQGREYYYSVVGRSALGKDSIASALAMGYALVEGAPGAPENADRAEDSGLGNGIDKIRIEWDEPGEGDFAYAVYRYTSEDATLRLLTGNTGNTYFEDTRQLSPGIYYYYQIQTLIQNEDDSIVKGPVSDPIKTFILSPPDTIIAEKDEGGTVSLKWLPAINVEEGDEEFGEGVSPVRYDYRIYGAAEYAGSYAELAVVPGTGGLGDDGYFLAAELPSCSFYKVQTINCENSAESSLSGAVAPAPAAAIVQAASQAENIPGYSANASGVYPVRVTWKKPENETPHAYHIYRSTSPDSGFRKITVEPVYADSESGGLFAFVDTTNQTAKPGKRYYYRILSLNMLGQGAYYSDIRPGYGALTYEQYMLEYNKTVKSSHRKMTYMNKPGSTEKLGSETKQGTISGTIAYNAAISGLGARITMHYESYADFYTDGDISLGPYFVLTGYSNTTAAMDQSGTMDGTINAAGMYPGKVIYDNIQIKGGAAAGGTYGIEPAGFPRSEISWTIGER
jgi:fibronectin type 3 domain-containing protein